MKLTYTIFAIVLSTLSYSVDATGRCRVTTVTRPKAEATSCSGCQTTTITVTRSSSAADVAPTPASSLPHCNNVPAGTPCTTAGDGSVGNADEIRAKCDEFVGVCKSKGTQAGDCENKGRECKAKVDRGDLSPLGPFDTFGFPPNAGSSVQADSLLVATATTASSASFATPADNARVITERTSAPASAPIAAAPASAPVAASTAAPPAVGGPPGSLPECNKVAPGTRCTSAGSLAVGVPEAIKAKCEELAAICRQRSANPNECTGKESACKAKVDEGDMNPNGPKNTFGFADAGSAPAPQPAAASASAPALDAAVNTAPAVAPASAPAGAPQPLTPLAGPPGSLPECTKVAPGTQCTSAGNLSVGSPDAIKAKCEELAAFCRQRSANANECDGKETACKAKVDGGDVNPNGPKNTFGFAA